MWLNILVLKFKQRINMRNLDPNFIGCKGSSTCSDILLCKIQDIQDPTITCPTWIQDLQDPTKIFSVRGPRSLRSHSNATVAGSNKIQEEIEA